jgi:hypothetical protein
MVRSVIALAIQQTAGVCVALTLCFSFILQAAPLLFGFQATGTLGHR